MVIAPAVEIISSSRRTRFLFKLLPACFRNDMNASPGSDSEQPRTTGYARHFNALQSSAIRSSAIVIVWQP